MSSESLTAEFFADRHAFAGFLFITGFLGLITTKLINYTPQWLTITAKCEHLKRRELANVRYTGEMTATLVRKNMISFVSMYWVLFTLKSLKDKLFENAIDVFAVVYMAQICALLIFAPAHHGDGGVITLLTEHLPKAEIAAVLLFAYVIWRMGLHWDTVLEWFHPAVIDQLRSEMVR